MSSPFLDKEAAPAATLAAVDGRTYPLRSARIVARAEGGMAFSALAQRFANPHAEPLEVLYTLPLPADGAVLGYTIRIGEQVIRAEVQPRERAERAYRDALYAGHTAGLLAQSRPDTFQQTLGNVPANTEVEVTIDVLHPLAFVPEFETTPADGPLLDPTLPYRIPPRWEYRFPTVVGVRYPGAPGRVTDAGGLSPARDLGGNIPTECELVLTIADRFAQWVDSPSHRIDIAPVEGGQVVSFGAGERLDRDVVVRWAGCVDGVALQAVEGAGLAGDDGRYVLVNVTPPAAPRTTYARDLTVLIDASGSMSGQPLELAKRVVGDLLRSLERGDRFELLAFANDVRRLTKSMTAANEKSLDQALAALAGLRASGGTEMAHAVTEAMKSLREDAQRQVVLVTDGQIAFEDEVVAKVAGAGNVRLHAVGVGSAPNRSLTQQAAAAGRGIEVLVSGEGDAYAASRRLVAATARPVLANVTVGGAALVGTPPAPLRDVFAGQPLVFTVEVSRHGGAFEVRGDAPGSREAWTHVVNVPPAPEVAPVPLAGLGLAPLPTTTLPLGALHGRTAIAALERSPDSWGIGARAPDERIEALGMRHRIASRRTSLVAISETVNVDPTQPRRRERLAVELPHGVSAAGVGLEMAGAGYVGDATLDLACAPAPPMARAHGALAEMPLPAFKSRAVRRAVVQRVAPEHVLEAARVDWLEDGTLALEFEVPHDDFEVTHGMSLRLGADGASYEFEVVPGRSTAAGRHRRGTIVRFVVRIHGELPAGGPGWFEWQARHGGPGRGASRPERLRFVLPPRRGA